MSAKDPFQILADELTLLRHDMAKLQRTSLSKNEAEALNELIVGSVDQMGALVVKAAHEIGNGAKRNRDQIARNTEQGAARGAQKAVEDLREHLDAERLRFAQAADATETAKAYFSVGDMARYSCERPWVRGVRGESQGQGYFVLWDE